MFVRMCISMSMGNLVGMSVDTEGFRPEWCISTIYHA